MPQKAKLRDDRLIGDPQHDRLLDPMENVSVPQWDYEDAP